MKCPYCNTEKYKTLREGKYCRVCGGRIWKALGEWVTNTYHDHIIFLVNVLECHKSQFLGKDYEITGSDRRFEMNNAATLLAKCDGDIELASYVFEVKIKRTRGYVKSISWVIGRGFDDDLVTARQQITKRIQEDKQKQTVASTIRNRSDLFDDEMEPTS